MIKKLYKKIRAIPRKGKEPYLTFYKIVGFYPHDISLYQQAVAHKSSSIRLNSGKWVNNERLEFLGDAILDAIIADILFKEFENKKEGFLTNMRSRIVQRETMNKMAAELGLEDLLVTSTRNVAHNTNMYGDALEALIAAIYLDQGYRVAKKFVFNTLIEKHLDFEGVVKTEIDFKSRLIEWGQKYKLEVRFDVTDSYYDKDHNPIFHSSVFVADIESGEGVGYSKKESHQKAAEKALKLIEYDNDFRDKLFALIVDDDKSVTDTKEDVDSVQSVDLS
ncbi:MAG: ribonuclease III [Bacteroidales bacterium]|nr:ribonuclease III [Bacteroidales bacterium]